MPLYPWQRRAIEKYLGRRYRALWKNRNFLKHYSTGFHNLQQSFSRLDRSSAAASEAVRTFFVQADKVPLDLGVIEERLLAKGFVRTNSDELTHSGLLDEQSELASDSVRG